MIKIVKKNKIGAECVFLPVVFLLYVQSVQSLSTCPMGTVDSHRNILTLVTVACLFVTFTPESPRCHWHLAEMCV